MNQPTDLTLASSESALSAISDTDFAQLTTLIRDRTGIFIPPGKKLLLAARLSERMRALGIASYADYHRHVLLGENGELARMTDAVCTNETRFFRDGEQLAYLEKALVAQWLLEAARGAPPRRIRVWSAGCSTGEEAFTIAMVLRSKLPADRGFAIEVLGTDISSAVVDRARAARWPAHRMLEIPEAYRHRFLEIDPKTDEFRPARDLRNMVRFKRLNLSEQDYPSTGRFDLILCRNVLIYFDTATRAAIARRLVDRLTPDGRLLLGMTESVLAMRDRSLHPTADLPGTAPLRSVGPAIYARASSPQSAGERHVARGIRTPP